MLDARDLPDLQRLNTAVCIVGAGCAGITLAMEFIATGIDVILLEAGPVTERFARLHETAKDSHIGRSLSAHGGTDDSSRSFLASRRSAAGPPRARARCAPLSDHEFEARAHIPDSGWPIPRDALASYYQRALRFCESDESSATLDRDLAVASAPLIAGLDERHFSVRTLDRYCISGTFAARFGDRLRDAGNILVLTNAPVTRIDLDLSGTHVRRLAVRTPTGRRLEVAANRYVLAAGTMENTRLLLANRDVHRNGIGNDRDNVGRFLMCPLKGRIGALSLQEPPAAVWYGRGRDGVHSRRRIALRAEVQHQLQLGGFAARLGAPEKSSALASGMRQGRPPVYGLEWQAEQRPNADSRLLLGDQSDVDGNQQLRAEWQTSVADFETVRQSINLLADDLHRAGSGRLDYNAAALATMIGHRADQDPQWLGTTRMGADTRNAVVDAECRVHGVDNLYVAGASVFPTSGLGDPVLTVAALSLRLADHLKRHELQDSARVQPMPRSNEPANPKVQALFPEAASATRRSVL